MVRLLPYLEYAKRTITHLEPAALIGLGALVLLIVLSVSLSLGGDDANSFNSTVMTIIYFLLIISVSWQLVYYFRSSKTNQKSTQG
jgi:protein-S-isoprenylcysteine O-methyltransferase Ste14